MTYDPQHPERGEPPDPGRAEGVRENGPGLSGQQGQDMPGDDTPGQDLPQGSGPQGEDMPSEDMPGQEPQASEPQREELPDQGPQGHEPQASEPQREELPDQGPPGHEPPGREEVGRTPPDGTLQVVPGSQREYRPTAGQQETGAGQEYYQPAQPPQRMPPRRDGPRHAMPPKSRRGLLVGAGIIGMLALIGLITGLTVAYNQPHTTSSAHLIRTFQFVGSRTSASFNVPSATTSAHYIFRCPKGPANFNARMQNTSGSDVQQIVNTSGNGGRNVVALHPKHPGSAYHLAVHTPCEYRVQVFSK